MTKNKFRFTETSLAKLTPRKLRTRYFDTQLHGLILDVTPSGKKSFRVYKKIPSRQSPVSVTIGSSPSISLDTARKMAKRALADIAEGINPNDTKRQFRAASVTLLEVFDAFKANRQLKQTTLTGYNQVVNCYLKAWHNKRMADINETMVLKRHYELSESSQAQADLTMRTLRALFNFARAEYKSSEGRSLFPFNPVNVISEKRAWNNVKRKQTRLRQSELKPFKQAIDSVRTEAIAYRMDSVATICDYVEFMMFTGLRKTELLELKWCDVYMNDKLFWLGDTKNGDGVELPITQPLKEIFARRKSNKVSGFVFGSDNHKGRIVEPKKTVSKILKEADLEITLHDLRRTYISIAESLGVGSYTLKRLLNHRTSRDDVTGGYTILTAEELREPAERVARKLMECAGMIDPRGEPAVLDLIKGSLGELSKTEKLELVKALL